MGGRIGVKDTGSLRAAVIIHAAERSGQITSSVREQRRLLQEKTRWSLDRINAILTELPQATRLMQTHKHVNFELVTRPPRKKRR